MAGIPPHSPRDQYTLFVWPDAGPIVKVTLNLDEVRQAGARRPNDPTEAEVSEVFRQMRERDTRLRAMTLEARKEQMKAMLRLMLGRIVRLDGMVYRAPGTVFDPITDMQRQVNELKQNFSEQLKRLREQAKHEQEVALKRQKEAHERASTELAEQYRSFTLTAFEQRDLALELVASAREAEARARIAEQASSASSVPSAEARQAQVRAGELEQEVNRLLHERKKLQIEIDKAAQQIFEFEKLRKENERLRAQKKPPALISVAEPVDGRKL